MTISEPRRDDFFDVRFFIFDDLRLRYSAHALRLVIFFIDDVWQEKLVPRIFENCKYDVLNGKCVTKLNCKSSDVYKNGYCQYLNYVCCVEVSDIPFCLNYFLDRDLHVVAIACSCF
jgi:hypothetical protein